MDILKISLEWAKEEVFSSAFFILFGFIFIGATIAFWQMGKTPIAIAFIYPTLVAGSLLLIIGLGLVYSNQSRLRTFETTYQNDASFFIQEEISRAEHTIKEYETVVFRIIPVIIIVAAGLIIFLDSPIWRAISITTIAMMVVILSIDSQAHARMKVYQENLGKAHSQF
ncbi:MAG: hypothetical protein AAFY71_10715 [Bacteroidota bacterium]